MTSTRADLSESLDLLLDLLDGTWRWRERLVEQFTLADAAHARVESSYQIDFPLDLIRGHVDVGRYTSANVLVPVTTRDKRLLLNLDLVGPAGVPAHLLSRASIAAIEAECLRRLIETSSARGKLRVGLPDELLEAICVFTPQLYEELLREHHGDRNRAQLEYLQTGLGLTGLTLAAVRGWREQAARAREALERLPADGLSSSAEILLAIPRMDPLPQSEEEIEAVVVGFSEAVDAAIEAQDDTLLRSLVDYGRRFEVIVEVEVPLLEPSTIKLIEDRPLGWQYRGWLTQDISLREVRSVHVEARTTDPNVVSGDFKVHDVDGRQLGLGVFESARHTDEAVGFTPQRWSVRNPCAFPGSSSPDDISN